MNRLLNLSLTLLFVGFCARAQETVAQESNFKWHTRYSPAVAEAKSQGKSIVIVFTGSDWIEICKVFERDILSQGDFTTPVSKKYTLLKLEFPRDNRLPSEYAKEYQLLKDAYRIRGFPSVMVTDAEGRPFGMNGYQPIKAKEYAAVLMAFLKGRELRDAGFAKAAKLNGLEKAKALHAAIPELPGTLSARYYSKEMEQAIKADKGNKIASTAKFRKMLADVDYSNQMQKLAADVQYDKMLELTDKYIADQKLEGEFLQKALLNKLGVLQKQQNRAGVVKILLNVVSIKPESQFGKSAQKMLNQLRAQKIQETLGK